MAGINKICHKIIWVNWDGYDLLVIQAETIDVEESEIIDPVDKKRKIKLLTRIDRMGSTRYRFNEVDTFKKVEKHLQDIEDGKI